MGITKFNTVASMIPTSVGAWSSLSTLEPATVGTLKLATVTGSKRSSTVLAQRFSDRWDVAGADRTSTRYIGLHPRPTLTYNPFRSHIYLTPAAGDLTATTVSALTASTFMFNSISKTPFTWTQVRLWMCDVTGAPVAPQGVWFAVTDSTDSATAPQIGGSAVTWVAGTSLAAPPAGTDDSPGVGPVCAYASVAGNTATQGIAIRIQMAAGATYTVASVGTTPTALIDEWSLYVYSTNTSITGNPGITTGWNNAFSTFPYFILEVNGLSTQQCMLGAIGDSHCRGYVPDIGGQGYRGVFGELGAMIGTKKLTVINLGRSGHTRAQIAKRVRAWENQLDMGGWIVQRASINDKDASFDYQVTTADSSWNYLQDDWVFDGDKTKIFIPWEGFGMTGAASGWYDRFNTHKAEEQALWPYSIYTSSSILNADGSYKAGVGGSDNGHPNILGYQTAAVPVWAGLQSALTTLGITI